MNQFKVIKEPSSWNRCKGRIPDKATIIPSPFSMWDKCWYLTVDRKWMKKKASQTRASPLIMIHWLGHFQLSTVNILCGWNVTYTALQESEECSCSSYVMDVTEDSPVSSLADSRVSHWEAESAKRAFLTLPPSFLPSPSPSFSPGESKYFTSAWGLIVLKGLWFSNPWLDHS